MDTVPDAQRDGKVPVPRPNHASYRNHRRDFTRQILLPILLVTFIGLGFAALAIYGAVGSHEAVSLWADISLIWLIIPMMLLALMLLALTMGLVYGLAKLLDAAPRYTGLAQRYALWLNAEIVRWTEQIIQPVLSLKAWMGIFTKGKESHDSQRRNRTA